MLSEMLGNRYFLARNYKQAVENFEYVLSNNPTNKSVRKKLIICYLQTGDLDKAVDIFAKLIKEDIDFIINTDLKEDACPCPELIEKYGTILPYEQNSNDLKLMLGMLWLYCDVQKSKEFFDVVIKEKPEDEKLKSIVSVIENRLKTINKDKLQHIN